MPVSQLGANARAREERRYWHPVIPVPVQFCADSWMPLIGTLWEEVTVGDGTLSESEKDGG